MMTINREEAAELVQSFMRASKLAEDALRVVRHDESSTRISETTQLVGEFMGACLFSVFNPLWRQYPDLRPPQMDAPYVPNDAMSDASRAAIATFMSDAREAMARLHQLAARDEAGIGNAERINELATAMSKFEAFCGVHRVHEAIPK